MRDEEFEADLSAYLDEETSKENEAYYEQWGPRLHAIGEEHAGDWWAQWLARREHYARHPAPQTTLAQGSS